MHTHSAESVLLSTIARGTAGHAWLLYGPSGSGKSALALDMAMTAFCTSPIQKPCRQCLPCRKALSQNHPDLHQLLLQNRSHGVDAIRELVDTLQLKPYESTLQITILHQAQAMTPQAQNALLKTLEQPPGTAMLILLATNPHQLLPTIRSRCRLFRMRPQSESAIAAALQADGLGEVESQALAGLSDGWLPRARSLSSQGTVQRDNALDIWERLLTAGPTDQDAIRQATSDRAQTLSMLSFWQSFLRDMLASHTDAPLQQADLHQRLAILARPFTPRRILDMMKSITATIRAVEGNALAPLAVEAFVWNILDDYRQ